MQRLEHVVPPAIPKDDGAIGRERPIGPGQFILEKTVPEKLELSGKPFELGEHGKMIALNRREVEMLLERHKQIDDQLAAEERTQQGHFSREEIQARRKRPGVQAIGLDMLDGEHGGHVWTEAMKFSYMEAQRSKISKVVNYPDMDQLRMNFVGGHDGEGRPIPPWIPKSYKNPEPDPSWTEEEINEANDRAKERMKLTSFEVALLVNLSPQTPTEAKALIKSLGRYEDADLNDVIHMLTDRLRPAPPPELYSLGVFGTEVTENHIGPILTGGASGLDGVSMSYRGGEAVASRRIAGDLDRNAKNYAFDFGDRV